MAWREDAVAATYIITRRLLGTNLFSLSQAEQHPDWLKEARIGEHTAETEEYGISSIVFRSRKPLDAGRLSMFFHASVSASAIDLDAIGAGSPVASHADTARRRDRGGPRQAVPAARVVAAQSRAQG